MIKHTSLKVSSLKKSSEEDGGGTRAAPRTRPKRGKGGVDVTACTGAGVGTTAVNSSPAGPPSGNSFRSGDTLYDKQRVVDDIFWDAYTTSESSKFQWFTMVTNFTWSSLWQRMTQGLFWYAERTAQHVVLYQGNDRDFWEFFLNETNLACYHVWICFSMVNLCFFLLDVFYVSKMSSPGQLFGHFHEN